MTKLSDGEFTYPSHGSIACTDGPLRDLLSMARRDPRDEWDPNATHFPDERRDGPISAKGNSEGRRNPHASLSSLPQELVLSRSACPAYVYEAELEPREPQPVLRYEPDREPVRCLT